MSIKLELPDVAVIPAFIRKNKNLTDAVKIYYGELTVLSYKYGYCFATDEQLAEMKEVSVRTIERWNEQLQQEGLIRRETRNTLSDPHSKKFKWIKTRRIFMTTPLSKNVTESDKNGGSIEPDKNGGSIEPDKNGGINTKQKNKQQTKPKVVVFSSLSNLNISPSLCIQISSNYSEQEVDLAVKRCLAWKKRSNDEVGIITTLREADSWQDSPDPEKIKETNAEFLGSIKHLDQTKFNGNSIIVGYNYFEISNHTKVIFYSKIDEPNFKIKVQDQLDKLKL
jgi:hypothetical protein